MLFPFMIMGFPKLDADNINYHMILLANTSSEYHSS